MKYILSYYLSGEQYTEEFDSSHHSDLFVAVIEYFQERLEEEPIFQLKDAGDNVIFSNEYSQII